MANEWNGTVSKFVPGSTTPSATLTGLSGPDALAFDSSGNLYVASYYGDGPDNNSTVSKFAPGSTTPSAILTGLKFPTSLAFDASGNLYVGNLGNGTVSKFAPGSTTASATLTGLGEADALAFDASGNLYVACDNGLTVSKFAPGNTTPSATLTGLNYPQALAFDSSGNLYVANCNFGSGTTVSVFTPGNTTPSIVLTGFSGPRALAFDSAGNLYVANRTNGTVSKLAATTPTAGGVVIRSSLPNRPMSLGGANNAVAGINLTDAELAQIQTTATGTVTVGDSTQTGNITFTTATVATTPGASTLVVQAAGGSGQIILDGAGTGTGLNGNGGTVTLTPGTGGIAAPISAAGVPLATQGFSATGLTLTPTLTFAPALGTQLTVINNTATPAAGNSIVGTFSNLPQGGTISASYGGTTYVLQANYTGGDGNDLVLTAECQTTTALAAIPNPSTYGQPVTFTATVSANLSGAGTPTGTVTFQDGTTILGTSILAEGVATYVNPALAVGTHAITAVYGGNADLSASTSAAQSQTVNPVPLTITADSKTKTYGAGLPTLTATYTGFVNRESAANLTTQPTITTTATAASHVGGYVITASGASSPNYTISYVSGTLSIAPAPLTITADNQVKDYGEALPTLTASYAGLVNGDTAASLTTRPTVTTTATSASHVGNYSITVSGAADPDYTISYIGGTLTVTAARTVITLATSPSTTTYGQAVTLTATVATVVPSTATPTGGTVTFTDVGAVLGTVPLSNGTATFSIASLGAGSHSLSATYSGDGTNFAAGSTALGPNSIISTVAGNGAAGYSGDGGAATIAGLNDPYGVALDAAGNLFIADSDNCCIREVNHATGVITTVAGNGTAGYSGDGGPATAAELYGPEGVALDAAGDLFIADCFNNCIREVNYATGVITTVAGNGAYGYSGDGGPATTAGLNWPTGVAVDAAGNLFIADCGNSCVREVNHATGVITTVAGNGTTGYRGDGGLATAAELLDPTGVAVDAAGNLFIADGNHCIREGEPCHRRDHHRRGQWHRGL